MRTETSKHDAVAWDATYTEPPGLPQELPESGVLDTEGEEMMDTTPGEVSIILKPKESMKKL